MVHAAVRIAVPFLVMIVLLRPGAATADGQAPLGRLVGRVVDAAGSPVEGATVCLSGKKKQIWPVIRSRGRVLGQTNSLGEFELEILPRDREMVADYYPHLNLVVASPGYSAHVDQIPLTRMQSDAPVQIRLSEQKSCEIALVDSKNASVESASVMPAEVDGKQFAFGELDFMAGETDASGRVKFGMLGGTRVTAVYVASDQLGKQLLKVAAKPSASNEPLPAKVFDVSERTIELTYPNDLPPEQRPDLSVIRGTFITAAEDQSLECVWDDVPVNTDGQFPAVKTMAGSTVVRLDVPAEFGFAVSLAQVQTNGKFSSVDLVAANLVVGRAVDSETREGIEGLVAMNFSGDWRLNFTDSDGRFSYWTHGASDGFYLLDPQGKHISTRAFYSRPEALPDEDRVVRVPEEAMTPMTTAQGLVLDSQGKPAAGVTVDVAYQQERFMNRMQLFTNTDGRFAMYQVPQGANLTLTASGASERTAAPVEFNAEHDVDDGEVTVKLQLQKVFKQSFTGRIVDVDGKPVQGAVVKLRTSTAYVEENFSSEDRTDSDVFTDGSKSQTDENGRFETPQSAAKLSVVAFTASAPGYRDFHSRWFPVDLPSQTRVFELESANGPFVMQVSPAERQVKVTLRASDGAELEQAQFLSYGPHSGLVRQADCPSEFTAELKDGKQIIAAQAKGYASDFILVDRLEDALDSGALVIELHPESPTPPTKRQVGSTPLANHEQADVDRRQLAQQMLSRLEPEEDAESWYKRQLRGEILLFTDPLELASQTKRDKDWRMLPSPPYQPVTKEFVSSVLEELDEPNARVAYLAEAAKFETEETRREQILDEIVAATKESSGNEQARLVARAAGLLIRFDKQARAKALIAEVWEQQSGLKDLVASGVRDEGSRAHIGVTRYFAPELVLVERRTAFKLIELGATANEIPWLQSQAVLFLANSGDPSWKLALRAFLGGKLHGIGLRDYLSKTRFTNIDEGRKLIPFLDSSAAKAQLLIHMAEQTDIVSEASQLELLRDAHIHILESVHSPGLEHPAWLAAQIAKLCQESDPILARRALFTAFAKCEGSYSILPFDTLAGLLERVAANEPEIARHLTQACVDDWSWLYNVRNSGLMFSGNRPLQVAARIDPTWATQLAIELMDTHLEHDLSRRLATASSVTEAWLKEADEAARQLPRK